MHIAHDKFLKVIQYIYIYIVGFSIITMPCAATYICKSSRSRSSVGFAADFAAIAPLTQPCVKQGTRVEDYVAKVPLEN